MLQARTGEYTEMQIEDLPDGYPDGYYLYPDSAVDAVTEQLISMDEEDPS